MPPVKEKGKRFQVARFRVKYKDIFDLTQFYKDLHFWTQEYNWVDLEDGKDHYENLYFEKIDMGGAKEIWMKWRTQKIPDKNSYYKYWLDFDFHCLGVTKTEVVKEGKKMKANKGEVELYVTSQMELDYTGEWSRHPILKYFNKLFPDRIFRRAIYEEHKRELYRETYELQNFIKQWFKLKRYAPYQDTRSFHPSYAWPSHLKE